jgi:hypothetical protein
MLEQVSTAVRGVAFSGPDHRGKSSLEERNASDATGGGVGGASVAAGGEMGPSAEIGGSRTPATNNGGGPDGNDAVGGLATGIGERAVVMASRLKAEGEACVVDPNWDQMDVEAAPLPYSSTGKCAFFSPVLSATVRTE